LQKQIERDWNFYAEAERSLKAASQRMQEAARLAEQTRTDQYGDSMQIVQAREKIARNAARLDAAWEQLKQPHGDWMALDAEADQIEAETVRLATIIRGQLQEAEAVAAAITLAAAAVRAAASWSGRYYTGFFGNAGRDALNRAYAALGEGLYPEALRAAEHARQAANRAIAEAEAEERRLRQEEEERQERERRRRREEEARRHSMMSSSRSSFHHGSGASRSSFSSGSGFKRSGW
jgi:hypothetical protein